MHDKCNWSNLKFITVLAYLQAFEFLFADAIIAHNDTPFCPYTSWDLQQHHSKGNIGLEQASI